MKFKKLTAGIVAAVMAFTAVATPLGDNLPAVRESTSLTAGAATIDQNYVWNKINKLKELFPTGSYFTKNGKNSCHTNVIYKSNYSYCYSMSCPDCKLENVLIYNSKAKNTVVPNVCKHKARYSCCGFATFVFCYIFEHDTEENITEFSSSTYGGINDSFLSKLKPGDFITCDNGTHYAVFLGYDNNNIYLYESNYDSPNQVEYYHARSRKGLKWSKFDVKRSKSYSDNGGEAIKASDHYKLTSPDGYQTIRKEASTNSANLGSINAGNIVCVTKYSSDNKWGYLTYNGVSGWIRLYYVEKTGSSHSYGSWYTKTSATCTSGGTEERKCSCGATESRSTSALGHNYGSWSTVTSATCTSGGSEKRTCSRCSNSETRSTSALGHNYGSTYFEADHPHKYAHLCQRCGYKEFTGGNLAIYEKCDICYNENLPSKPCLNISSNGFKESDNVSFTWDPTDKTTHYNLTVEVLSGDEYKTVCRQTYVNSGFQATFGKGQYRAVLDSYNSNMFHQYTSDWRDWVHNSSDYVYFDIECAHEFLEEVVSPTYDNEGYTLHKCTKCGYSYKDNYTPALKLTELTGVKVKTQGSTSLTLAWDKNASASGYVVEQYKGGKWTQIAKTSSNATVTYTVNGLKADTTYTFRIKGYVVSGTTEYSGEYTRLAAKTRIANVASFKGSAVSASAVKLDWSKNDKATGYVIEQYKGGKWTAIATTKNNTTLTFTVKGLAEGTAYSFRIKSFRKTGSTTDFSEYTAIKAATLLDSVSNLKVTSVTGSWITLEWAKNDKATGYSIEQYKGGKWTVIATTKNNTTLKFTVKGLKNDTTYSFRIRAYKTVGGVTAYSDYVRIAGKTRIPNVAKFTGSAVSASAVKLDWSKNDKATGYVIEQYKGGKWTAIATTKNNTTLTFTVKGLAKGTAYSFRIKSFRKTGSTTEFSEYASVKVKTVE